MLRRSSHSRFVGAVLVTVTSLVVSVLTAQQQAPFTTSTDLVVVPVVVEDGKGAAVTTLTAADFSVREDGEPVAIETFVAPQAADASGADGRFVVLALDNLNVPAELTWRVKDIAMQFVRRMTPADDVSVIALDNGRASSGMGREHARVAVERFAPQIMTARTPDQLVRDGLESLRSLSRQMARSPHRRKVLVIIGAGAMFNPSDPSAFADLPPDLSTAWEEALREAGRGNVSVYLIDPFGQRAGGDAATFGAPSSGPAGRIGEGPNARHGFVLSGAYAADGFVGRTGGHAWMNTNNYRRAVEDIWRDAGTYYLIGYRVPINDHRLHDIAVTVKRTELKLRFRRSRG